MAIEINQTNNPATNVGFDDTVANLELSQDNVQQAIEDLDARVDANEQAIVANNSFALGDLTNVDGVTVPTDGQLLGWSDTNQTWEPSTLTVNIEGDMLKSVYDADNSGIVDNSQRLASQLPAYYLDRANHTGTQTHTTISNFDVAVNARIAASSITDLSDVNGTPADTNILSYNTTNTRWEPIALPGDMLKATYDTTNSGIVDNAEGLDGNDSAYHLDRANHTGTQLASTISDFTTAFNARFNTQTLVGLADVDGTPTDGQTLTWNNTAGQWEPQSTSVSSLDDISDVDITSADEDDVLMYLSGSWKDTPMSSLGSKVQGSITLQGLSNVESVIPNDGEYLVYSTTNSRWEPSALSSAPSELNDLTNVQGTPTDGQVLTYNNTGGYWEPQTAGAASEVNDLTASVTWANVPDANVTQSSVTQHQAALSITESQISDLGTYETAFSKNTGFNLNLGSTAGTVCEGNDSRLSDARTPLSHTHATTDITSGTFADARIAQSNVTQHQAALSITESQISDFGTYLTSITAENLADLSDVGGTAPSDGQVLTWNNTNSRWEADDVPASGSLALNDLTDVDTTGIGNQEFLMYASGVGWIEKDATETAAIVLPAGSLAQLSNVHTATPTDGQVLTYVNANSRWEPADASGGGGSTFSGCRLYLTSTFTASTASSHAIKVAWTNEEYDTDSYHDNVTNNTRITVPGAGVYQITGAIENVFYSTTTNVEIRIYVNGSFAGTIGGVTRLSAGSYNPAVCFTDVREYSASDYIEIYVMVDTASGSFQHGITGGINQSTVQCTRLKDGAI